MLVLAKSKRSLALNTVYIISNPTTITVTAPPETVWNFLYFEICPGLLSTFVREGDGLCEDVDRSEDAFHYQPLLRAAGI